MTQSDCGGGAGKLAVRFWKKQEGGQADSSQMLHWHGDAHTFAFPRCGMAAFICAVLPGCPSEPAEKRSFPGSNPATTEPNPMDLYFTGSKLHGPRVSDSPKSIRRKLVQESESSGPRGKSVCHHYRVKGPQPLLLGLCLLPLGWTYLRTCLLSI